VICCSTGPQDPCVDTYIDNDHCGAYDLACTVGRCIKGVCCPSERDCGTNCCPEGLVCHDRMCQYPCLSKDSNQCNTPSASSASGRRGRPPTAARWRARTRTRIARSTPATSFASRAGPRGPWTPPFQVVALVATTGPLRDIVSAGLQVDGVPG
jgi:hypothetical protein